MTWVGFELRHKTFQLCISERRAELFIQWCRRVAASTPVNTSAFEEGLGKVMYVAAQFEYGGPWASIDSCLSTREIGSWFSCQLTRSDWPWIYEKETDLYW